MPRHAVGLPNVGPFADPRTLVELAVVAEERGWDGVFLWDHLLYHDADWPVVNPVVVASAIADIVVDITEILADNEKLRAPVAEPLLPMTDHIGIELKFSATSDLAWAFGHAGMRAAAAAEC